jgi:hypothetical protein
MPFIKNIIKRNFIMFEYPVIAPPFTLKFANMSKKELDDYFEWYLAQIAGRISILKQAVKSTPGYEGWEANCLPESLYQLGEWFANAVETRKRTKEEINETKVGLTWPASELPVSEWELTNKTFSIAVDIGMYLSQVMLKNIPGLKWEHKTEGSKRWIDYGQPVLSGFGEDVFNPIRMMVTLAYGLVKRTRKGDQLAEIYKVWKTHAPD